MGLHLVFRNSSLMSRIHIGLNEKNKLKKYIDSCVCWNPFWPIVVSSVFTTFRRLNWIGGIFIFFNEPQLCRSQSTVFV